MNVNYRPQVKSDRIHAYSEMTALGVLPNSRSVPFGVLWELSLINSIEV